MIPSFLITFREVIEACLIVATILGILIKLNQSKGIRTVWMATGAATLLSIVLLILGSIFGIQVQKLYTGKIEAAMEGSLLVISAFFITWAVFFLHKYFTSHKVKLLQKVKNTVEQQEQKGLFVLVFTAVFREGFEIILFLTTIYFSSNPMQILSGFTGGMIAGIVVSLALFSATLRLPVRYAFKVTSILLILFAGGMLIKGIHEFTELGFIPETREITFAFIPQASSFMGSTLHAIFGITRNLDIIQLGMYAVYTAFMGWWVFIRKTIQTEIAE